MSVHVMALRSQHYPYATLFIVAVAHVISTEMVKTIITSCVLVPLCQFFLLASMFSKFLNLVTRCIYQLLACYHNW